jgi:hypothetical protein
MNSASGVIFTVKSRGPRPCVKLGTLGPLTNGVAVYCILKDRVIWLKKWPPNIRQDLTFCCSCFYFFTSENKQFLSRMLAFLFLFFAEKMGCGQIDTAMEVETRELTSLANFIHLCTPEINCRRETKPIHLPVL